MTDDLDRQVIQDGGRARRSPAGQHADRRNGIAASSGALQVAINANAEVRGHIAALQRRIVSAQEDERGRIARNLHEQVAQRLTAVRLALQSPEERLQPAGIDGEQVQKALSMIEKIEDELDFLAWGLQPMALDEHGLATALQNFVREWSDHYDIPVEYRADTRLPGMLSRDAEAAFYRVTQEALDNVLKHAHASRVDVLVEARGDSVRLVVEDNGVGFQPGASDVSRDRGHHGIAGMHEWASLIGGTLQIESQPGRGTSVYLESPADTTAGGAVRRQ
jgi:signal transduction histidine kinase